ncbi:30S ribosomal protein S5 [bacterium]|jgi:small subunit ribosomal protein S5|nr:30S ribosomal protein S5 [bacterium]
MTTKDKNKDEKVEEQVEAKTSTPDVVVEKVAEAVADGSQETVEPVADEGEKKPEFSTPLEKVAPEPAAEGKRSDGHRREQSEDEQELIETVVRISRVAKVVKGGRRFSFSTISVVGDGKGRVGVGLGKANEVPGSIQKSFANAKRNMISTVMVNGTIPYEVSAKSGAGKVFLKPASEGTGVIAGGSIRAVVEAAGYRNILSKSLGSNNPVNVLRATVKALESLQSLKDISKLRGRTTDEIFH